MFQQLINDSDWGNFFLDCAEGMFTVFKKN